jgi:hypothetical protein
MAFEGDPMRIKLKFSLSILAFITYAGAARADESNPALMTPATSPTALTATLPDSDEEFGVRAGFGPADVEKKLYATTAHSGQLNSRLRYDNMTSPAGELFGRVDLHGGSFVKGVLGIGTLSGGHLNDEDFPPAISPYSSTLSSQRNGFAGYGTVDFGLDAWRDAHTRVGGFLGASYLNEKANAFGCTQIATNDHCTRGAVAPSTLGITENTNWTSARLGVNVESLVGDRLRLGADAVWLPYTYFDGENNHWLRATCTRPSTATAPMASSSKRRRPIRSTPIGASAWACVTGG